MTCHLTTRALHVGDRVKYGALTGEIVATAKAAGSPWEMCIKTDGGAKVWAWISDLRPAPALAVDNTGYVEPPCDVEPA